MGMSIRKYQKNIIATLKTSTKWCFFLYNFW